MIEPQAGEKQLLRQDDILQTAIRLAEKISSCLPAAREGSFSIYGVPRGGVPVAMMLVGMMKRATLANSATLADVIVDDIVDSGATFHRYRGGRCKIFASLYIKQGSPPMLDIQKLGNYPDTRLLWGEESTCWLVFPWEMSADHDSSADDICLRLLQYIGEDPSRGGLKETPQRFLKAWKEWSQGYNVDTTALLKTFKDGAEAYDEMVIMRDIPIYSHCEHHLAPFFGEAHIAYIPNGSIVGLSKLARLAKALSQRLQVQERLTNQIANALEDALKPRGIAVVLQCRHLCMESRGVSMRGSQTITSAVRGAIAIKDAARAEFMSLIK